MNVTRIVLLVLLAALVNCNGESTSLFDPDYEPERPDPVVNTIEPDGGYLAGVDEIILKGENFSTNSDENLVYFDGTRGLVHSATETELVVRPALVVGEEVTVKVAVQKAINFTEPYPYRLDQAVFQAPGSIANDNTLGIAVNSDGDIFYSNQQNNIANGIRAWRTDGTVEDPYIPSSFNWTSLKVGPDGLIYGARNIRGIYREAENGTIDTNPFAIGQQGEEYIDFDFDPQDYIWAVGDNSDIYRVDIGDGSIERFAFEADLRAIRYYEGKLYLGGRIPDGSEEGSLEVWTMDVNNGQVSNPQLYLRLSDVTDFDFTLYSITFDANGRIYLGADTGTGIYTWTEDEGFNELYPGLIEPDGYSFSWHGEFLIASATNLEESTRFPLKINLLREGAPYEGIE